MKKTKVLALCSVITALSVVVMFLGGITFVLAYAVPMFVGAFTIMLNSTVSKSSAWITYFATSALSLILVADRECSMMYLTLFGYYPIIVSLFDKIRNSALKLIAKLIFFNIVFALCQLALVYVFGIPFLEEGEGRIIIIVFAVLMNFLFIIYDRMILKFTVVYKKSFEKKVKKLIK